MRECGSVTIWLDWLKAGELDQASRMLWEAYYARLVAIARSRLATRIRAVSDEEDVALSAFGSFVLAAAAGRFPDLDDRDDLWRLLFLIVTRKAADVAAKSTRKRRGGGNVVPISALEGSTAGPEPLARDPDPAEAAAVSDELTSLLGLLHDDVEKKVAILKLEGYANAEIAPLIGKSVATVERKLRLIRSAWQDKLA